MTVWALPDRTTPAPINGDDGSPGFGVYLHWPFCAAKCPYCDFNSHVRHAPVDQRAFADAFIHEMAHMRSLTGTRTVTSIFIGGGTPSLMAPETLGTLLDAVAAHWRVPANIEVTMEANPQSADANRFAGYRTAGVNRLSLGVQALNDADLKFLGRLHDADEARAAIELARRTFPRLSFDLIYARPGQTLGAWASELRAAIALAADHLSLYQLTIEDGTPFKALHAAGRIAIPESDLASDLYAMTQDVTADHGLPAYEISNHAAPGAQSRHNLTYWRYGDYAGIGPGAHGRFSIAGYENRYVTITEPHPETWLERVRRHGHGITETETLDRVSQADEMLMMGLRLTEGLDLARHETLGGREIDGQALQAMIDLGMVERIGNARIRATARGRIVLDSVIAELAQ
ncbi:MAG: coproporphyrinogen III oxidase [Roseitalea sp.]|nr:coproporphyrinogen III oxidase [Roseitalea sp.]MBO6953007.1 coproporphyrinogen III oxidase [Rhizobiaceae bacterium]MBO6593354.1 coproporphyrinogen III oxidase [Roseitalea sp.]MBO6600656.1 coproporphyrinogen III oxidase [Roseitalea sp.]MBO6612337.1 coproporphyrinogen III oxidase [Roseitalea sp.]